MTRFLPPASFAELDAYPGLSLARLEHILGSIAGLRVGVFGDGCLDVYWQADMTVSQLSRETPHYNLPVVQERCAPGGAANTAVNFKRLGCAAVEFGSAIGEDWRGRLLREALQAHGVGVAHLSGVQERMTPTYCKLMLHGVPGVVQEAPRVDFVNRGPLPESAEQRLLETLDRLAADADVISVTDQMAHGVVTPAVRERLAYWAGRGKRIGVDSRERIGLFRGALLKPNELEALRALPGAEAATRASEADIAAAALRLSADAGAPCCVTVGDKGALWAEGGALTRVPTSPVPPPVDIVGAGDSFMAAFLAAWGAGSPGPEAAAFAHLAAAVTVGKLGQTGSASPEEIVARWRAVNA